MSLQSLPRTTRKSPHRCAAGFTLVEVLVAIVVLIIGVVGIAQLVPTAIGLDDRNRASSLSLFVAERELDPMLKQSLEVTTGGSLTDYSFVDPDGQTINLGALPVPATGTVTQAPPAPVQSGCPLVNGSFNFTAPCGIAGYTKTSTLAGRTYETRWNVVTVYGNNLGVIRPVSKRITIASISGIRPLPPLSVSVLVAP